MNDLFNFDRPIFALTVGHRGGFGKSTVSQINAETLRRSTILGRLAPVIIAETDLATSSMAQIGLATQPPIDMLAEEHAGAFLAIAKDLISEKQHAVIDTAAGHADRINGVLERYADRFVAQGVDVIVFLPLTAAAVVQQQAINFVKSRPSTVAIVMVKNLAQGRKPEDFRDWEASDSRKVCLELGAVETIMESVGVAMADNASSWQLSFANIVAGDFNAAGDEIDIASTYFDDRRRLFIEDWLDCHAERYARAMKDAIAKVRGAS